MPTKMKINRSKYFFAFAMLFLVDTFSANGTEMDAN